MAFFSKIKTHSDILSSNKLFVNKFFINYGYIEDGPGNDLLYSNSNLTTTSIQNNPSLKKFFKQISNQYSLGSCVANAVADAFEAQMAQRKNCDPSKIEDISRLFIYWNARNLSNPPTCNIDDGSRIRLAFDSMARYGAPPERIYPYDLNKVNERPSIIAYREAIKNRISKFYRIDGKDQYRIFQMKQALSSGNPIVFGTAIEKSFNYVNDDTIVYKPEGKTIGRHAMCCVGWSEEKQSFEVRNSWGESWGNKGYCWIHKDYLASILTSDIWVPTI